jgi:hypothetical protein
VQLRLELAGFRLGPLAATGDRDRRRAEQLLQLAARSGRCLVALDAQRQAVLQVGFGRAAVTAEGRNRRREDDGPAEPCGAGRQGGSGVGQGIQIAGETEGLDREHLLLIVVEGAERDEPAVVGIAEKRRDEVPKLLAVGLQEARGVHRDVALPGTAEAASPACRLRRHASMSARPIGPTALAVLRRVAGMATEGDSIQRRLNIGLRSGSLMRAASPASITGHPAAARPRRR